ncbi:hypothetical protein GALMADRAFT_215989 [Galerina marginata CBS 339.88]|uniref:Uncharacterized protein n=1 Tax=Galerina marginata (strain CBS 339.88) TaxID=685588 RepID=A0A067SMT2_GALM3|nr:hypothetical protein GALMADRAFT_215989 [Galerina marginata CBS 339.88]
MVWLEETVIFFSTYVMQFKTNDGIIRPCSEHRANARELLWRRRQVSLNFTNDFPPITSEADWAFEPKALHIDPQSGGKYTVSMHQQLYCLDKIRIAFLSYHDRDQPKPTPLPYEEAEHCLEQLRQTMLCNADLTLEPTKAVLGGDGKLVPAVSGLGVLHRCWNWRELEWKLSTGKDSKPT